MGFLFLDYFEHCAYAEEKLTAKHIRAYEERFGKLPPYVVADKKYGSWENREMLEGYGVRASFKSLGRPKKNTRDSRWFKNKQRERNRIEGHFGNGKQHYGLDRVRYSINDGSEIWVRAGILAMNLKTAMNRA